jgi:uncharacterized protein (DUF983 family)
VDDSVSAGLSVWVKARTTFVIWSASAVAFIAIIQMAITRIAGLKKNIIKAEFAIARPLIGPFIQN